MVVPHHFKAPCVGVLLGRFALVEFILQILREWLNQPGALHKISCQPSWPWSWAKRSQPICQTCHTKPCLFSPKSHGWLAKKWWISGTPKALTLPGGSWQSLVAKRPWYLARNSGSTYDIYHQMKYFPSYTSKIFENRNSVLSLWFHAGSYFSILWSRGGFQWCLSHSHCATSLSSHAASMKIHTNQSQGAFAATVAKGQLVQWMEIGG